MSVNLRFLVRAAVKKTRLLRHRRRRVARFESVLVVLSNDFR
jgi:hypothetical protein